jgi:hypothetical protein
MGSTVCRAVVADPELQLVAAVDPLHAGIDLRGVTGADLRGLQVSPDLESLARAEAQVAVDFTHIDAARANLAWCAANGVHAVVGTSGVTDADVDRARELFTTSSCVIAPNFAIGAVLMMHMAELAAPWFETVEIIELHHDAKVDAPGNFDRATNTCKIGNCITLEGADVGDCGLDGACPAESSCVTIPGNCHDRELPDEICDSSNEKCSASSSKECKTAKDSACSVVGPEETQCKVCQGGSKDGSACTSDAQCKGGGTCIAAGLQCAAPETCDQIICP